MTTLLDNANAKIMFSTNNQIIDDIYHNKNTAKFAGFATHDGIFTDAYAEKLKKFYNGSLGICKHAEKASSLVCIINATETPGGKIKVVPLGRARNPTAEKLIKFPFFNDPENKKLALIKTSDFYYASLVKSNSTKYVYANTVAKLTTDSINLQDFYYNKVVSAEILAKCDNTVRQKTGTGIKKKSQVAGWSKNIQAIYEGMGDDERDIPVSWLADFAIIMNNKKFKAKYGKNKLVKGEGGKKIKKTYIDFDAVEADLQITLDARTAEIAEQTKTKKKTKAELQRIEDKQASYDTLYEVYGDPDLGLTDDIIRLKITKKMVKDYGENWKEDITNELFIE